MRALAVSILFLGNLWFAGAAAAAEPILGVWLTKGGKSHVRISKCGNKLCGTIIWLKEPNKADGTPKTDTRNPDAGKRTRKIIGVVILNGFNKADEKGAYWTGGKIYNPEDGKTYNCYMRVEADGRLKVRGYVAVRLLGKTQYWTRVK